MHMPIRLITPLLAGVIVIGLAVWAVIPPSAEDPSQDTSAPSPETSPSTESSNGGARTWAEDVAGELFEAILGGAGQQTAQATCDPEVPGRDVTAFTVCEASGRLISTDHSALGARATWQMDIDLASAARAVLEQYRDSGSVTLTYDGYIDLFRNVWGCVVAARSGWTEIVVVSDRAADAGDASGEEASLADEETCTVTVVRLDIGGGHEPAVLEADEAA